MTHQIFKWSTGAAVLAMGLIAAGTALAEAPTVDRTQPTPVVYPKASQIQGEEGTVVLDVSVNDYGNPTRAQIVGSSGYADLDTAATETVLNWHYVPGDYGVPARVRVSYKLPEGK